MRRTVLLILLVLSGPVASLHGQTLEDYDYENLFFRGLGVELGWILPPRVDDALSLGIRADLGLLGPNVRIRPGIAYWSSQMQRTEVNRLAEQIQSVCLRQYNNPAQCPPLNLGSIRMSDLMLNLDAHYEWPESPFLFIPYAGLGGGIHLLNARGEAITDTFIEDFLDSVSPALNLFGGMRFPLTSGLELTGEARYVLAADIRHAALTVGALWALPTRPGRPAQNSMRR
jgi:hypothetical protein